jgi:hypothetical protein
MPEEMRYREWEERERRQGEVRRGEGEGEGELELALGASEGGCDWVRQSRLSLLGRVGERWGCAKGRHSSV